MGALQRTEARVILGAAVIDDILAMLLLGVVTALQSGEGIHVLSLVVVLVQAIGFVALNVLVGTTMMRRSSPLLEVPVNPLSPLTISVAVCLGLAVAASYLGLAAIIGAFLAGKAAAETKQRHTLERQMQPITALIVPFFFVLTGAKVNVSVLGSVSVLGAVLVVTVLAVVGKLLGCGGAALSLGKKYALMIGTGMVEVLKRQAIPLIALTSHPDSPLAQAADLHLDLGVRREACPLNLAPTASTTASLALGDALAMAVSVRKGFREEDFAALHPGGKLGKRFLKVGDLMHRGEDVPRVAADTPMKDVIYEMSRKGLGVATVQDGDGRLLGVITDGDLRRLMERDAAPLARSAAEVMHSGGVCIGAGELASAALRLLEDRRITSLMVCGADGRIEGVLHLHELWGVGLF